MANCHTGLPDRDSLTGQDPFHKVHQGDVVADEKDALDGRVVALQKAGLVGQQQCLAAPRGADDDPVPAVELSRQGLLVVIQDLKTLGQLGITPLPRPVWKIDTNFRKKKLLEVEHISLGGGKFKHG